MGRGNNYDSEFYITQPHFVHKEHKLYATTAASYLTIAIRYTTFYKLFKKL